MKYKMNFTLFLNESGRKISPMKFYIYDCKEKKELEKLINDRCGILVDFPTRKTISLSRFHIKSAKWEVFSINFIFDCCKKNKLLDIKFYRFSKIVNNAGFDPMDVLKGRQLWPVKISEDEYSFYKNECKTQECNQIEPSAPKANSTQSRKKIGRKCTKNLRFQNNFQFGMNAKDSSAPRTLVNTFVNNEMSISTDLFNCSPQFSENSCRNSENSKICIIPKYDTINKGRGNYFSAHNIPEVGGKNNVPNIENKSLKSQTNNTNHKHMKQCHPTSSESNKLKVNNSIHNIYRELDINCVYDHIQEEIRVNQRKCHFSNVSETNDEAIYNHVNSITDQSKKEVHTQTYCDKLSDKGAECFSTAQSYFSTRGKSKTTKSRHFVCSSACEHDLSGMMGDLRTSFSSQTKCDKLISGCENSSVSSLIQNSLHDFSSSSDSSFDEFSTRISEHSLKYGNSLQNIIEESATKFKRKLLPEQFNSDHESNTSVRSEFQMNNEDGVIDQPYASVKDNYVSIYEEKCKNFLDNHHSSTGTSMFNQKECLTEMQNDDVDNVPVSFKTVNQSLNTGKTVNYDLSLTDVDLQVVRTEPENFKYWGEKTDINNEIISVGNNTFNLSNKILSIIKDNFMLDTNRDCIPHHVKISILQDLLLKMYQRRHLSSFTSYDIICGTILCQPLLNLIRDGLHNNQNKTILLSNDKNNGRQIFINENEQPQLIQQSNDTVDCKVSCFSKSSETQEKSESVLSDPIINTVSEKYEIFRGNDNKGVPQFSEIPIYDDNDDALYSDDSCESKYSTLTTNLAKVSGNNDKDVAMPIDELLENHSPFSKVIPPLSNAFPHSQCKTFDSVASSISIHDESVELKFEDTLKEPTADFESMKTFGKCVNNNSDGSFVFHTKHMDRPCLNQELSTGDKLTDSIPSKDDMMKWNERENKNSCETKEINDLLSADNSNQLKDEDDCSRLVDGSDMININDIQYPTCTSSQESDYFRGLSPDVDLVLNI